MHWFSSADMRRLLHNKFVVVLGDSIQRSVYKDLVKLLKEDNLLSDAQMKGRGELDFEKDTLVEGGMLTGMHNGVTYREVRQYRTGHHLVRFYFLTRVYSTYLESILSDFQSGPQPDVVIVNSCVWDLLRYHEEPLETYKSNLDILFQRLKVVLSPQCLVIWTMTMPVGYKDHEIPENVRHNLRGDIVEGNFFSAVLADFHKVDVLDMHYHFRWNLHLRWHDAVHWHQLAHRKYTQILLSHMAQAWGVKAPKFKMPNGFTGHSAPPHLVALRGDPYPIPHPTIQEQERCNQAPFPFGTDIPQLPDTREGFFPPPPGFPGHSAHPPHPFAWRGDPYFGPHPTMQEQERCRQAPFPFGTDSPLLTSDMGPGFFRLPGFPGHSPPPHPFAFRGDPYPGPHPSIQDQERCNQGFPGHFAPPHPFAFRGDPYPGPHPSIQEQERGNQGFPGHSPPPHPFAFRGDPYPGPHPSIQEQERCNQGFPGHSPPPHPFAFRGDPYPGPHPIIREQERCNQGFPGHSPPPHPFAFRDPYPGPHPSIQDQERCNQGFPGHSPPPHPFALRGDPYLGPHPSIQEQERCNQGSPWHSAPPHPFELRGDPTMQDQESCNQAPFPIGTDSPQLPDTMEGFFPPPPDVSGFDVQSSPPPDPSPLLQIQEQEHGSQAPLPLTTDSPLQPDTVEGFISPPPDPEVSRHPFPVRKVLLSTPQLMNLNLTPFPNHAPYLQEDLNKKIKRRRRI